MVLALAAYYGYLSFQEAKEEHQDLNNLQVARKVWKEARYQALARCRGEMTTMDATHISTGSTISPAVQSVWLQALFGSELPAKGGKTFVIPPPPKPKSSTSNDPSHKLGLVLRRLPLGLYVYDTDNTIPGIRPGSILVGINGMPLLAEPTSKALQRIISYQQHDAQWGPLLLTFMDTYQNGQQYTVPLLHQVHARPWGISWAPCGHFCLVQRTYARAAHVPKGTLLLAVQGTLVSDHVHAARLLKEPAPLTLVCAMPPAHQRPTNLVPVDRRKRQARVSTSDGVEIKFHNALEMCQGKESLNMVMSEDESNSLDVWTNQVAAGMVVTTLPPDIATSTYGLGPRMNSSQLLSSWDALSALVTCLQCQQDDYLTISPALEEEPSMSALQELLQSPRAIPWMHHYLLPTISVLCASSDETNELTSLLLKLSRKDEAFCQKLYFILRSTIATLQSTETTAHTNLMALLHCIELLRFAEKEAATISHIAPPMTPVKKSATSSSSSSCVESPAAASPPEVTPAKKRGVMRFFGKKKKKRNGVKSRGEQRTAPRSPKARRDATPSATVASVTTPVLHMASPSAMYENMCTFLAELDEICSMIEGSLQKSFRQKIAEWAMQPWSASKESAVVQITAEMRASLRNTNQQGKNHALINPVETSELLSSVDPDECYILPSAQFPLLLSFNVNKTSNDSLIGDQRLYRTTVEVLSSSHTNVTNGKSLRVHAAVAGQVLKTSATELFAPRWSDGNRLVFDSRSSWGAPKTLSIRLSGSSAGPVPSTEGIESSVLGFGWVDLSSEWESVLSGKSTEVTLRQSIGLLSPDFALKVFDEHGYFAANPEQGTVEVTVQIKLEVLPFNGSAGSQLFRKRQLLYKHDDDLRQEAFTVDFFGVCDDLLKASGLDLKLLTFRCIPIGDRRGFVEWVPGSVPLSEICQSSFAGRMLDNAAEKDNTPPDGIKPSPSMISKAGLFKYESLRRSHSEYTAAREKETDLSDSFAGNNPVQDYLRSIAYDADAPYLVKRDVMDTYVKSCAGYSVMTYILGVGDRHLDNLLLHQSGSFFHCDYSFILGSDPKNHVSMRVTDDMVLGMGGKGSDNYIKFSSMASAAFLALRRPEAVQVLLSMIRAMESSSIPDISVNRTTEDAILGVRERLRLDLTDDEAVEFVEKLIEENLCSKIWLAVDAIHTLGKKF